MILHNRSVVITGAATGIGRAAALCCAAEGARTLLADINREEVNETVRLIEEAGHETIAVETDVTNAADVEKVMQDALNAYGSLDTLIHSAGILDGAFVPIDEFDIDTWNRVINVNLTGSFLAARYASAIMKPQKSGVIILLASGAGVRGGSSSIAYGSSKGGVHGLALVLESQLSTFGIRVHAVCPGGIATPLKLKNVADGARSAGLSEEEGQKQANALGDPEGVGKILAFLASESADFVRQTIFTR